MPILTVAESGPPKDPAPTHCPMCGSEWPARPPVIVLRSDLGTCKTCGESMIWATRRGGGWIPLDRTPRDSGGYMLYRNDEGKLAADTLAASEVGYGAHKETCMRCMPAGALVVDAEYDAIVSSVEAREGRVRMHFAISHQGVENTFPSMWLTSTLEQGSDLRVAVETMLGRSLQEDETLDFGSLVGLSCVVMAGKAQTIIQVIGGDLRNRLARLAGS